MKTKYFIIDLYTSEDLTEEDFLKISDSNCKQYGGILSTHGFISSSMSEQEFKTITNNQSHWDHKGSIACTSESLKQLLSQIP